MNVNLVAGRRSDSAHGYLHPVRAVQNYVHLIIDALVISILFDETTARHLEYINQSIYIADSLMFRNFREEHPLRQQSILLPVVASQFDLSSMLNTKKNSI